MTSNFKLSGCFVAIVTPFTKANKVDYSALQNLAEWHIQNGISGIVPCGTTGESVCLSETEYRNVITTVVEKVNGRIPVIAGAGGNNTYKTMKLAEMVAECGANALLSVCPYYNKPTQKGIIEHFKAVSESTNLPLILYNVPGRSSVNMLVETTLQLAELPGISGIKEASANLIQIQEIIKHKPEGFSVLSGDDQLALQIVASGGDGVISVVANQMPAEFSSLIREALAGNFNKARKIQYEIFDLMNLNFIESNPIPVKTSLALMGKLEEVFRLPLLKMESDAKSKLVKELKKLKLID